MQEVVREGLKSCGGELRGKAFLAEGTAVAKASGQECMWQS